MLGEVAGIFEKMGTIVKMHETMIERIDKNTEDALINVEKGKK
jgi:syntaxin 5